MSNTDESFPFKDLSRRKFQTGLTILSLSVCVSVTVFLVVFGQNLGIRITAASTGELSTGFLRIFSRFILMIILLNSATGILVAYYLLSTATSERIRDIGIMKAVGCLTEVVYHYFSTELLLMTLAGCAIGTIGGALLNFASIGLMNLLGYQFSTKPLNVLQVFLIASSFAFIAYVTGLRIVQKATNVEVAKALSPLFILGTTHQPSSKFAFFSNRSVTIRIALRSLARRRTATLQTIACLSVITVLVTLAVVGCVTANETTQNYVERAIGRDIFLIAKNDLVTDYKYRLLQFSGTYLSNRTDYLDWSYSIPISFVAELRAIRGIIKVDPRLIFEATVHAYPAYRPDPNRPGDYTQIGDFRSDEALIVGFHAETSVSDWLVLWRENGESGFGRALVGDSLSSILFQNPWEQIFKVSNAEFQVDGICLDPLNNGKVIYVPFDRLSTITGHSEYNVVLVQLDTTSLSVRAVALAEIEAHTSGKGLVVFDLNEILGKQEAYMNYIWSLALILSLLCFLNAIVSVIGYLTLSISGQQKDLGIMRALGTTSGNIQKIVIFETLFLVLSGTAVGLPIGTIIALQFLVPEATVSQTAIISTAGILSSLFSALCLSSLYPARKMAKAPIISAFDSY